MQANNRGVRPDIEGNNDLWLSLKTAIQDIQRKANSLFSFEELHTNAYTMVLNRQGKKLYLNVQQIVSDHLTFQVRAEVIASMQNKFLETLNRVWNDHQTSMRMIRDIVMYMDRVYVKKNNVDCVFNLGLILFREKVIKYKNIRSHLQETLLQLIMQERCGEIVDRLVIKNMCQMLITLGLGNRLFYEVEFEEPFLIASSSFYAMESQKLLSEDMVTVYIRKVHQRISEEIERSKHCLHNSTEERIVRVVEEEFVHKHVKAIVEMEKSGVKYMLQNEKTDDLACMYEFFSQVPSGHETIMQCAELYLKDRGKAIVQENSSHKQDGVMLIKDFLKLKDLFEHYFVHAFHEDQRFKQIIDESCEYLLNLNPKTPEYVSLFIDYYLKKGALNMNDQEVELLLNKAIILFQYLHDKDLFERYYKQHLAKRLLLDKSVEGDFERYVISKLKIECGYNFSSHLECMFKDMSISSIMSEEFKAYVRNRNVSLFNIDLKVQVLTTIHWPLSTSVSQCNFPIKATLAYEEFKKFYLGKHASRQLTLQPQLGSADLKAIFYGQKKTTNSVSKNQSIKEYIISVSTYQMCILMLFNTRDHLAYAEIINETGIPEKFLVKALQPLAVGKSSQRILVKTPKTKEILPSDSFCVNDSFTSQLRKIKIQSTSAQNDSEPETRSKVEEDRKHEIDAAVVRIMKMRKTMKHNELIAEVTDQLKSRFLPSITLIKKRLENLIDREYLARMPDDKKTYTYVT